MTRSSESEPNTRLTAVAVHLASPVARPRPSYTFSAEADAFHSVPMSSRFTKNSLVSISGRPVRTPCRDCAALASSARMPPIRTVISGTVNLLRRQADPRPVRPAALVGAAEAGRRRPGRADQLGDGQVRGEELALERGDVLVPDQLVVHGGDGVPPQLRLRDPQAEVTRDRPRSAVGLRHPREARPVRDQNLVDRTDQVASPFGVSGPGVSRARM